MAEIVAPGIISTGDDYCTTLSPDGKTLYFARKFENDRDQIMKSMLVNSQWSEPTKVEFSGIFSDPDPLLTPDGNKMYFMSNRNAMQDGWKEDYDIWVVDLEENGWGRPYQLPDFINSSFNEGFPSTTSDETLYFFRANKPGFSEPDIWYSKKVGGGFDTPVKLCSNINTDAWEGHAFVSPEEEYLIFYSTKDGGYGRGDLYISFRENGGWGQAKNLGPRVNNDGFESLPFVSRDEKTLYFTRGKDGQLNIYQVSFDTLLKELKSKP